MSDKPPFDPSAPFSASPPDSKPAFDPGAAFTTEPPKAAPTEDVGGPAITWGQQQFSPGLPAVNAAADVLAKSANKNLIEPIKHPIDTVTGLGRLALGAAQYAGLPGEGYKGDVDALARDYAQTYGSLEGFKKAITEDPVRVAMDASMAGGLLGKAGRAGSASRAARVAAPTTEDLFDAAHGNYQAMHGFGVELHPHVMDNTATQITTDLKSTGFRPILAPKTFALIDELRNPEGKYMTTQEVEGVRRALGKVSGDPTDMAAARHAIGAIDDTMAGLTPADAAINGHFAPRVAEEAVQARGNYAAGKRAEQLETAKNNAELQAASTGSGANIDNATRQKIRAILTNPKKRRGFDDAELEQMDAIVRGTPAGNVARLLGKLAPTGVVSGTLSAGLGHVLGHTIGVPVLGAVAKAASDAATRRAGARLGEQVRLRSPLAQKIGATAKPPRILNPRPALQAGRLAQPNGDQ